MTGVGIITALLGESVAWYSDAVRTCPIFCPGLGFGFGFGATGTDVVRGLIDGWDGFEDCDGFET